MKQLYTSFLLVFIILHWSYKSDAQVSAAFTVNLPSPACNPAVVSFTNTSTGIPPLTYTWNFGVYSGTNSIFTNPTTTYISCGTYTVTLYVTNGLGQVDSAKQTLTIRCSPVADFSISSTHGCAPFDASYTDLSTPGDGTIASELWDFGDGYLGSGPDPSHTYTAIGCNTVTLIVTNSYGCKADTTVTSLLCVYEPPVVNFTSSDSTSCAAPFPVNFNGTASGGLGPYNFNWNFTHATPSSDSIQNPSATFNSTGTSGVQVIVTDHNGCSDTVTKSHYINIANNIVDFNLNATAGCAPFFAAATSNVTGAVQTYQWTLEPGNKTSTQQNPGFTISVPGTDTLCLTADFNGGCLASKCKTITVYQPPTADFFIAGNLPTCINPSYLLFTDNSSGDSLSYNWSFPGGSPSTYDSVGPVNVMYSTCGTYSASETVTDVHGCSATMNAPDMFTLNCIHANFTVNPNKGCIPLSASFNSSSSIGGPFAYYEWNFGDPSSGTADTSSQPNPTHTYNNQGCYDVTLIVFTGEGCSDTLTIPSAVCAGQKPRAAFSSNPPVACANAPVQFTNQSTNVDSSTHYEWDFVGGPNPFVIMSTDSNPTYIYNDTGWFNATLVAINNGCSDTITHDSIEHILPPVAVIVLTRDCSNHYVVTLDGTQSMGAQTYSWVIPGGNPSTASTPTVVVTYAATGNYTASLFVTNDSTGCSNNTNVNITIKDVFARFSGSPLQGCATLNSCMSNTTIDGSSYQWTVYNHATGAQVTSSTQTSPCFSLSQPGVYDVRLIATDQFGCSDTLVKSSYIKVWGVNVGFYGTPLMGCSPLQVQFTDTSSAPNSTIASWSWNFGDPSSGFANSSTLKDPTHTYNNPGFYTVKLTVTDNHGCAKTVVKFNYIEVVKPAANFTLSDTALCYGDIACFTNLSTGNGLTYFWSFGDGTTSDSITPCKTYYASGAYSIVLNVTDASGCTDTFTRIHYVTVTKPFANFIADTTHSSCPPLQVQFTNLSTQIDPNTTYLWNFGDGSVSNAANPVHIYNIPGSFTVTLIVTNQSGCKDTLTIPNYIVIGGPAGYVTTPVTSGCNPLPICFTAHAPSAVYFTWNYGDGNVQSAGDSICYTYSRPGTFHPELILNDGAGCIYALPIGTIHVGGSYAYFKTSADTICGPGVISFVDSSWSFIGISSRLWNFGDPASGTQNNSSSTSPSHYYSTPGTYIVTLNLSSPDGCNSEAIDTVVVKPLPVAAFTMSGSSVCPPDTIYFTNTSTASSPIVSYLWNFDDPASGSSNTSNQLNPYHYYTAPGTYTITLTITDSLGCSANSSLQLVVYPPAVPNAGTNKNICLGTSGATLTATGGTQYAWTPSAGLSATNIASPLANPVVTTTYNVIVTTINGCFDSAQVVVYVHPVPQIDSSIFAGDTCAAVIGSGAVFVTNGTLPYSYLWSNSATTSYISNLQGGITYTVTVTDSNACVVTDSISIPALPPATLSIVPTSSTCGNPNGSISLTLNGGQAPYNFIWSNGSTTQNLSNVPAGNYSVIVTDAFKCTSTLGVTLNNIASPTITLHPTNTTCSLPNGKIHNSVLGGTSPFTYLWNNGATTKSLSNILAGAYNVTVTDANNCTVTASDSLIDHPGPVVTATKNDASCNAPNGSINLNVAGGTSPFTFVWNGGYAYTENLSNIYSGNYSVLVTDSNSCKDSVTLVINDTPKPRMSFTATNSKCGFSDGSITITMNAGISPFTFAWSNASTSQSLTNIPSGNYQVTVTGANGCTLDTVISINDTINSPVLTVTPVQPTCGSSNGAVNVIVNGGHTPYVFDWNSGTYSTQNLNGLIPGNYYVQVTDSNGCRAAANTSLSNIAGPVLNSVATPSTCGNANGSINLNIIGGTGPYTYAWSNGATTQDINNVLAEGYFVTVTDSNLCMATWADTVTNIAGPGFTYVTIPSTCTLPNGGINVNVTGGTSPFSFNWNSGTYNIQDLAGVSPGVYNLVIIDSNGCTAGGPITLTDSAAAGLSLTQMEPTCGNDNGSVNLTVTGYGPFSYNWNNNTYTTQNINNLSPGTYTVTVTDVHSCTSSVSVALTNIPGATVAGTIVNATCGNANGSINITLSGGTAPFTFEWSDSSITQNISSLAPGNYTLTVTDANSCITMGSFTIKNIPGPGMFLSSTNATCGNNNGTATIGTSGGTLPFSYLWNNGATTQTISSLNFGTYYATVTDSNNCTITDSVVVTGIIGPTLSATPTNTFCDAANGSIALTVSGGTAPFTYNWNGGAFNSEDLFSIPAASYVVNVTDANGCPATDSVVLTNTPGPSAIAVSQIPSTCGRANGGAAVQVTGGTTPYTYLWNTSPAQTDSFAINLAGSNTYKVTVTDINGCTIVGSVPLPNVAGPTIAYTSTNTTCGLQNGIINVTLNNGTAPFFYAWNTGATTQNLNNLAAANYHLVVSDANGCMDSDNMQIDSVFGPFLTDSLVNTTCGNANGAVFVQVQGGTLPYSYNWNNGAYSQNLSNLINGSYSLLFTDGSGCKDSIKVAITGNPSPVLTSNVKNATCGFSNGAASVAPTGGTPPFTYLWNNTPPSTDSFAISLVGNAHYIVAVTDSNGCQVMDTLFVPDILGPTVTTNSTGLSCGNKTGTINLIVLGGTQPYSYSWDNGAYTTQDLTGLAAGHYTGIITDSLGCEAFTIVSITGVPGIKDSATMANAICGNPNGNISLSIITGTAPYTFDWNTGATTQNLSNLNTGTFIVTITDSYFCTAVDSFNLSNSGVIAATDSVQNASCGKNNGSITLSVTGGLKPYHYKWNTGDSVQDLINIAAASYSVTITDSVGCSYTTSIDVNNTNGPQLNLNSQSTTCNANNGVVNLTVTGSSSPYSYNWNNGATTQNLSGIKAGNYSVTVTDSLGCIAFDTVTVGSGTSPHLTYTVVKPTCGLNNGSIDEIVNSGLAPFTYTWNTGSTTQDLNNITGGNYQLIVSDSNGCRDTSNVVLDSIAKPQLSYTVVNTTCNNPVGAINLTVNNGTAPFSFAWNNGATTKNINGLNSGIFIVNVTDSNSCSLSDTINVINTGSITANTTVSPSSCGSSNGSVNVTVTGGVAPYNYKWNRGDSVQNLLNVAAGNYSVIITDSLGCSFSTAVNVGNINGPQVSLNAQNTTCNTNDGSIALTVTGSSSTFSFSWNNGSTIQNLNNLAGGNYKVTVTDSLGCKAFDSTTVISKVSPQITDTLVRATCGIANGAINISIVKGIAPFSFAWSNGATTQNINGINSGNFIVIVTDSSACSVTDTFNITNTGILTVTPSSQPASCGNNNGSANITVSGGVTPYTYSWSTGATMQNLANVVAAAYSFTVTDSVGCNYTGSVNVGNIGGPQVSITSQSPTCNANNGNINLTVTGASSTFSYNWSNGSTTQNLTGIVAAKYNVTVTDSLGCKAFDSVSVTGGKTPVISYVPVQPTCGNNNGGINITVTSGTPPYQYSWSNSSTTQNITAVGAGSYLIFVTDSLGCFDSTRVKLFPSNAPVITINPLTATVCTGSQFTMVASGANSYTWAPASFLNSATKDTVVASVTSVTTFTVTGLDTTGCSGTQTVVINLYPKSVVAITAPAGICMGSSTTLSVGGNGNYTWSGPQINGTASGTTINIIPDTTSTYFVYTTDVNGCNDTAKAVVDVNPLPIVNMLGLNPAYCLSAPPDTLIGIPAGGTFSGPGMSGNIFTASVAGPGSYTITYSYSDAFGCSNSISKPVTVHHEVSISAVPNNPTICHNSTTIITASGCQGYQWSPSYALNATTGAQVIASPAQSINYTVTGIDSNGCSGATTVSVTVSNNLVVTLNTNNPSVCKGGSTTLSVSGANNYAWSPATGLNSTSGSSVTVSPSGNSTYTITGTNATGCTGKDSVVVIVNPPPVITATPDTFVCNGASVPLNASGAQQYLWSPSTGLNSTTGNVVLASPNTSLSYVVTGTDANGCTAQKNVALTVNPNPVINATNNKECTGEDAQLTASGAANYTWSPFAGLNTSTGNSVSATANSTTTYTITGTSSLGCSSASTAVLTVNPLPAVNFAGLNINYCLNNSSVALNGNPIGGTFSGQGMNGNIFDPKVAGVGGPYNIVYSYTDNNGCSARDTQPVNIYAQPNVTVNSAAVCSGNAAQLIAGGADFYIWSPSTGLNTTSGSIVTALTNSPAEYTVTGSTTTGCSASAQATVSVIPLPQLVSNISSANVCTGGNVVIMVGGASSYEWSPAMGLSSTNSDYVTVTPVASAVYTIIGENSSGCSDTITIPVNVLPMPAAVAGPNANICQGGLAVLHATGNGSFTWTPPTGLNDPTSNEPIASPFQTTTYTLTVTAANGCTASDAVVVRVYNSSDLHTFGGGTICLGDSSILDASGGFDYHWEPQYFLNDSTGERVISKPTVNITYTVTANSSIGCPATDTVSVIVRQPIYVKANAGAALCEGESYQLNATGDGVTYQWSPAGSLDNPYVPSPVATPTITTTYTVVSSDMVCFTASDSTVLIVRPSPELETQAIITVVPGSGSQLNAYGNGSFQWSPATGLSCTDCSDPIANPLQPTTYTVTETDSAGCRIAASVQLNYLCDANGIYVPNAFTPNGDGKNDVFRIRGVGIASIKIFRVFSRWGQLVFETNDIDQGWDGTFNGELMFPAVYVYYIEGICSNGQIIEKQGNVTLIR